MRRRLLIFFALSLVALLGAAAALPWWLGGVLHLAGASRGLKFAATERLGYARFALRDVEYRRGPVRVTVARIEADTPVLWLSRWATGNPRSVVAGNWLVEIEPENPASVATGAPPGDRGWMPLRAILQRVAAQLDRWLPRAQIGEGSVRWSGGSVSLKAATWGERTLTTKGLAFRALTTDASVEFPAGSDDLCLKVQFAEGWIELRSRGPEVTGELRWWNQPATLIGRFDVRGWLPAEASMRAEAWKIPGEKLKLGDLYSFVRTEANLDWSAEHWRVEVAIKGEPSAGKSAPPLDALLRGTGDTRTLTIETLHAALPGVTADLTEAITIERSGRFRESGARFKLAMDLAKQPWFSAQGRVTGEARLISGVAQSPVVDFQLKAREVIAHEIAVASAEVEGQFEWPSLRVAKGMIVAGEGEQFDLKGSWDFRRQEILAGTLQGQIRRATLARWLPAVPGFDTLSVKAAVAGPVSSLKHSGEMVGAGIVFPGTKPLGAKLVWRGTGPALADFTLHASAGDATLNAAGVADLDSLDLKTLNLAQNGIQRFGLAQAARVRWNPGLRIEELHLVGMDAAIDANLVWGLAGKAAILMRNVPSAWLADWIALPGPAWQVNAMTLNGAWDHGPLTFDAVVEAAVELGNGRRATIVAAGRGEKDGITLQSLRLAEGTEAIVAAKGFVPIVMVPGVSPLITIDPRGRLFLDADTVPNAAFWRELAALTGFELNEPTVSARVSGSWSQPEGRVQLQASRLAFDPIRFKRPLPTFEALDIVMTGNSLGLTLERLSLRAEGQAIAASGRLPVGRGDWSKFFAEPVGLMRSGAELRLEIPGADLGAFARFLPAFMAPKGHLALDLNYQGGAGTGSLRLSDAATRPLGPLGVLQEVQAEIILAGNTLELRSMSAKSGGENVRLTGRVELPDLDRSGTGPGLAPERYPKFDLALKGKNLPFVRRPGLLLRGDLDLSLTTTDRGSVRLGGTVRLRDSLFLQDLRALRPGGTQVKARRPPYFAVETPPLDGWTLDVDVQGDRFMRVGTVLFTGVASARFHLGGTLGEPVALGDVTINEGTVRLPFATFDVREGRVTLTPERPFEPQLWLTATSRRFNYDVRLEASGAASAPVLSFSSSPPLDHSQVLLMVMAGQTPKNEVSFTDQQRAARLGTFLGQSLLASLGESENSARLNITTGEKVSRQGRETYDVEYRLNNRWSVTGDYDEFDNYNAGVKWRVFSRGGAQRREANDENKP